VRVKRQDMGIASHPAISTGSMNRQRGAAVIVAMLVVALAAIAASGFVFRTQVEWRKLENAADLDQARWILRAAEQWAAAILQDDARQTAVDHLDEPWARKLPPVDAEGYRIGGRIEDQDGRFNLNNLVAGGRVDSQQLAVFTRLLVTLKLPAELAEAVADWLDADDEPLPGSGAEAGHYRQQAAAALPPNRPLLQLNELLPVRGMSRAVLDELVPFVTALPQTTWINVNTARPEVLAALIDGLTLEEAYRLTAQRERAHFRNLGDLRNALPEWIVLPEGRIAFTSRYFLVTSRARHGRIAIGSRALLDRNGQAMPNLIWRAAL